MKKLLFGLCSVTYLSACAMNSRVPYQVNSTPPGAQIYVNHVSMGIAPIQIELACDKIWRCRGAAPCGWDLDDYVYEVTAYPTEDNSGPSQTKRVSACQLKDPSGYIYFDLELDAVESRQRIDVNVNQSDKTASLDDTIRTLER